MNFMSYYIPTYYKFQINENTHESLVDLLNDVIACMIELSSKKRKYVTGLRAVLGFLRIVFSSSAPNLRDQVNKCYKVYIEPDNKTDNKPSTSKPENSKTINFWCFSPKFGLVLTQCFYSLCESNLFIRTMFSECSFC